MVHCFLLCTVVFSLWDHLKWGFTWSVIFCSLGWGYVSPEQFCACFCRAFQEYQLMKANLYVNFLAWGSYIMQVLWVQTLTQVVTASQRQLPFSTQGPGQDRQAIWEGLPSPYLHSTFCSLICWSQLPCSGPSRFSSLSCKVSWAFQMSVMSCESVPAFFSRRDLGLFHNIAENWSQKIQIPLLKYPLPIYPFRAYCQHLSPCHPLHIYRHLGYDNHIIIGRILQEHPDWPLIVQSRKLRSQKFGDFLKSTQMMRDWSGPWIWAFQGQDQPISIYPFVSQISLSAYHMLGLWLPIFFLSSAPEEFDTCTHQ